jgi:endonuclease YncB( thermonuclease family)
MMLTEKDAVKRLFLRPWMSGIPQGARTALRICLTTLCLIAANLVISSPPAWAESACSSEHFDEVTKVRYVHDGDTLHLSDGRKVRLIGINTPELARDNKAAEAFAIEAKNALRALFDKNKTIALVYGKDKKDRYGRLLAHTYLADGQNVQALLLTQGYASAIIIPPNTKFAGCYLEAENTARCNKTGLWQKQNILQASQLENRHIGFHLLRGTVESIAIDDKGIWLNLDNRLTVGIRPENRALFDIKTIEGLLHQSIVVRGWVNKSNRTRPFYLRLKHPLSLQTVSALNCH